MYTGNTIQITYCNIKLTVYPCVYREHEHVYFSMRLKYRFIPVYIGNTKRWKWLKSMRTVYPCVYREHHSAVG